MTNPGGILRGIRMPLDDTRSRLGCHNLIISRGNAACSTALLRLAATVILFCVVYPLLLGQRLPDPARARFCAMYAAWCCGNQACFEPISTVAFSFQE